MARYASVHDIARGATKPADESTEAPKGASPARPNKYAGKCHKCGAHVPATTGLLGPKVEGKFTVEHRDGECSTTPVPVAVTEIVQQPRNWFAVLHHVPDGKYTIVHEDHTHTTFEVETVFEWRESKLAQHPDAKVTILRHLTGPDNDGDYTNVGEFFGYSKGLGVKLWKRYATSEKLTAALLVLIGDPRAAAASYGMASGNCGICGRTLTEPESIQRGIGPVCIKKAGWA